MTKFHLGTALAALSLALPGAAFAQKLPDAVVVVVDMNRVANECNACRSAATTLQGMVTNAQQRAQQLGQPLQTEAQSISQALEAVQKQAPGAARTQAEAQLQTRAQAFQTRQQSANQEIGRLEQQIQSTSAHVNRQIREKVVPIVNALMRSYQATIAIDKAVTLDVSPSIDITNAVLTQLNTALPAISVTPLPQAAPAAGATPPRPATPGR